MFLKKFKETNNLSSIDDRLDSVLPLYWVSSTDFENFGSFRFLDIVKGANLVGCFQHSFKGILFLLSIL